MPEVTPCVMSDRANVQAGEGTGCTSVTDRCWVKGRYLPRAVVLDLYPVSLVERAQCGGTRNEERDSTP